MHYYSDTENRNIPVPEEFEEIFINCRESLAYDGFSFSVNEDNYCNYIKCKIKNKIQEKWQEIIDNGYEHNGETFDFDDTTLSIIGARLAHCNSTTNIGNAELTFYTSEKKAIVFADKASIVQFFEDFIKARNSVDQKRVSLKAEIDSAETVEKAEAVDITTGW